MTCVVYAVDCGNIIASIFAVFSLSRLLGAVLGTQTEKCKPELGLHPGILEAWLTMGTENAPGEGSIMCLEV